MGIGISILLIAAGLILALAVDATVAGLDIHTVGWILAAAGVLGLVLEFALFAPRRRVAGPVVEREVVAPTTRTVVEERQVPPAY
ncbi:hypothetical protein CLV35_2051 [Motilibacter peucedani]|uniref:DUF6458 domain-containing protein n=1 Tax=Motilibacter peucedani TaxID=598650 RepID=A0A420XQJ4_9ACTN|nr:DUF6458 family protein [Motilibacter peucedani]RKS75578.1 hypothetical protein CLV35_2051 [Motilibacter peucedani]